MTTKKLKPHTPTVLEQERLINAVRDAQRLMAPVLAKKYARTGFLWGLGFGMVLGAVLMVAAVVVAFSVI